MQQHTPGQDRLESGISEKNLDILVEKKLNLSQQCASAAKKVNINLGGISKGMAIR